MSEHRFDQDLFFRGAEGNHHIVMDVQAQGMEAQEQGNPAQVRDNRFFVVDNPSQNVVLVGFGIVVANQEDRTVSERTQHDESSNVLVMGIERRHGGVVLGNEGVGRHSVHVLRHQRGDHTEASQCQTELEVQGIVDGVEHSLVTVTQLTRRRFVTVKDFLKAVTDSPVGAVHMTGNNEDHGNCQMVVRHIREPQGLGLGMESTQEGQNRSPGTFRRPKDMARRIGILGVDCPVTGKEGR